MSVRTAILVLAAAVAATRLLAQAGPSHFSVSAAYAPPAKGEKDGAVEVTFSPTDPDVNINEEPSARLTLDPAQTILVDRQPPAKLAMAVDPATAKYIDLGRPVRFAAALHPKAAKGTHDVKGKVVYFYCSKKQGWCRRGSADVSFAVTVP